MALTVGTDTYITVADAKTQAAKFNAAGVTFSQLTDADVETHLIHALNEIEELILTGTKRSSGNALEFPRSFFNTSTDTEGTTVAAKAQVYNAVAISEGLHRVLDERIIDEAIQADDEISVYQPLASVEAYALLERFGYIESDSPSLNNKLISSRTSRRIIEIL